MKPGHYFEGIQNVVHVNNSVGESCKHCREFIGPDMFANSFNHYINSHGYRLLHVGTETSHDMDGKPWHSTVAVLGK